MIILFLKSLNVFLNYGSISGLNIIPFLLSGKVCACCNVSPPSLVKSTIPLMIKSFLCVPLLISKKPSTWLISLLWFPNYYLYMFSLISIILLSPYFLIEIFPLFLHIIHIFSSSSLSN